VSHLAFNFCFTFAKYFIFLFLFQKSGPTVTKVVTVVTTKKAVADSDKKKGELMENDQDAMEVILH
jgi:hypothetical protein